MFNDVFNKEYIPWLQVFFLPILIILYKLEFLQVSRSFVLNNCLIFFSLKYFRLWSVDLFKYIFYMTVTYLKYLFIIYLYFFCISELSGSNQKNLVVEGSPLVQTINFKGSIPSKY